MFQKQLLILTMLVFCASSAHATVTKKKALPQKKAPIAQRSANRSPAGLMAQNPRASAAGVGATHDIEQELKITGQSRNLSMGLLFQKDKDKLSFGTARTNYKDKIVEKSSNF
jgi:hypothetical protein